MISEHKAPPKPFQFTLRHMAGAILVLSLCLALIVQLKGRGFGICGLGLSSYAFYKAWKLKSILGVSTGITTILIVCILAPLWMSGERPQSRRAICQFNLRCIGIALQSYHDHYGCFPPAYIADANGQPMHSWRVLLLPYLEYEPLYAKYDFNEPWNGPNNSTLVAEVPRYYQCPTDLPQQRPRLPDTSYLAVAGPGTAWPGDQSVSMQQITDGTSNTLLVVEVHHSGVNWMDPRDLDVTQMVPMINYPTGQGIRSSHNAEGDRGPGEFAQVLYCDGSVRSLSNKSPPGDIRAFLTIAGGEKVNSRSSASTNATHAQTKNSRGGAEARRTDW
jgi:Protein of unknown function (DUF1559)